MAQYKIHFTDNYGQATIETDNYDEFMTNLKNDPNVDGIWVEYFDPEEGWQA